VTDVLKVFTEEPAALRGAARGAPVASLEALLAPPAGSYGRAYLAGTHLGPPRRVGLTALADASAFVAPLLAWAAGRPWTRLGATGAVEPVRDPAAALLTPAVLAVGGAPVAGALAAVAAGDRADALRVLLDGGACVLVPEPAHDGHDWSVFGPAPLGLAEAVRAAEAPAGVVRFVAPLAAARGESKFYFEQWALDAPPPWAERV